MTDDEPANDDDSGSNSGWWPFGDRRVRNLKRKLREARSERDEFQRQVEQFGADIDGLREENEHLEELVDDLEKDRFTPSEVLAQLGRAVAEANEDLAGSPYSVDDLEAEFKSRFAGIDDGIGFVLPDTDTDPSVLSTITLRVVSGREPTTERQPLLGAYGDVGEGEGGATPSEYIEVPDVREMTVNEATDRLEQAGFTVDMAYQPDEEPVGIVIEQSPDPFAIGPAGETIEVTVGGAPPVEE